MELIKNLVLFFYKNFNNQNHNEKVLLEKINSYSDYFFIFLQNNLILILVLIFLLLFIVYLNLIYSDKYYLIFYTNVSFFLIILILFPLNVPFTDLYNELELLFSQDSSQYIFSGVHSEGYLFVFFRILHVLVFKHFNLNYNIIIYLNFLIFFVSFILVIFYLKKNNLNDYIYLFILLFFSGKWFVHFYEPVNIVWSINFILILLFACCNSLTNNSKKFFFILIILSLSVLNFKAGIVICIYSIIYGFLIDDKIKNKIIYILLPFLLYLFSYSFTQSVFINETENAQIYIQYLTHERNYFDLLINFVALHSLALTPSIFPIKYFAFIIIIGQYFYILKILSFKRLYFKNLKNFIINNPLIVIGILGCFLISLSRDDYNQSRYMTFSLCFQVGFFIVFLKNTSWNLLKKLINKKILVIIFLSIYSINLILPNQGIMFAFSKNYIFNNIKKCFELNDNDEECLEEMFYQTFYDSDQNKFDEFKDRVYKLKRDNLSIFFQIDN